MLDYTSTYILLLFLVFIAFAIYLFKNKYKPSKSSALKKSELIKSYEEGMINILRNYENDKEKLQLKKIEYLKKSSHELHNNIFFDANEAKDIIKKLASL